VERRFVAHGDGTDARSVASHLLASAQMMLPGFA
jgi:hypothetical protein